eukprot:TRINITY_DN9848_c0_g1_i2.p1 TRINITY_DN9848_c0_g1~~TRINITY_DN9848_c0_g1_i2.p1  ORF type:complete len:963 (+),score=245.43 TRINITY_DN9848_c0_g1_i2:179-3067(+)
MLCLSKPRARSSTDKAPKFDKADRRIKFQYEPYRNDGKRMPARMSAWLEHEPEQPRSPSSSRRKKRPISILQAQTEFEFSTAPLPTDSFYMGSRQRGVNQTEESFTKVAIQPVLNELALPIGYREGLRVQRHRYLDEDELEVGVVADINEYLDTTSKELPDAAQGHYFSPVSLAMLMDGVQEDLSREYLLPRDDFSQQAVMAVFGEQLPVSDNTFRRLSLSARDSAAYGFDALDVVSEDNPSSFPTTPIASKPTLAGTTRASTLSMHSEDFGFDEADVMADSSVLPTLQRPRSNSTVLTGMPLADSIIDEGNEAEHNVRSTASQHMQLDPLGSSSTSPEPKPVSFEDSIPSPASSEPATPAKSILRSSAARVEPKATPRGSFIDHRDGVGDMINALFFEPSNQSPSVAASQVPSMLHSGHISKRGSSVHVFTPSRRSSSVSRPPNHRRAPNPPRMSSLREVQRPAPPPPAAEPSRVKASNDIAQSLPADGSDLPLDTARANAPLAPDTLSNPYTPAVIKVSDLTDETSTSPTPDETGFVSSSLTPTSGGLPPPPSPSLSHSTVGNRSSMQDDHSGYLDMDANEEVDDVSVGPTSPPAKMAQDDDHASTAAAGSRPSSSVESEEAALDSVVKKPVRARAGSDAQMDTEHGIRAVKAGKHALHSHAEAERQRREKAALRLQASFRGMRARKQVSQMKDSESQAAARAAAERLNVSGPVSRKSVHVTNDTADKMEKFADELNEAVEPEDMLPIMDDLIPLLELGSRHIQEAVDLNLVVTFHDLSKRDEDLDVQRKALSALAIIATSLPGCLELNDMSCFTTVNNLLDYEPRDEACDVLLAAAQQLPDLVVMSGGLPRLAHNLLLLDHERQQRVVALAEQLCEHHSAGLTRAGFVPELLAMLSEVPQSQDAFIQQCLRVIAAVTKVDPQPTQDAMASDMARNVVDALKQHSNDEVVKLTHELIDLE